MIIVETERLVIRHLTIQDAEFICSLLNEPSFIQNIGHRGVSSVEQARSYIDAKTAEIQDNLGRGMYLVELKGEARSIGICGLVKRDALADPDLGFALMPEHWGKGYALEAAQAVVTYARSSLGLSRLLAVAASTNHRSTKLLEKLGFVFEALLRFSPEDDELSLYVASI
ncbi:MAG: GNAT family N-acetyltransferase [Arenimonas sp.]